jgi:ribonuclease P protein component
MNILKQPKIISIKKKKDIIFLIKNGEKIYTEYGIFYLLNSEDTYILEYAVLIKKNVDIAAKRNYYKRIIREYIRENINKFGVYNKIVFLYNKERKARYKNIKKEFDIKLNIL